MCQFVHALPALAGLLGKRTAHDVSQILRHLILAEKAGILTGQAEEKHPAQGIDISALVCFADVNFLLGSPVAERPTAGTRGSVIPVRSVHFGSGTTSNVKGMNGLLQCRAPYGMIFLFRSGMISFSQASKNHAAALALYLDLRKIMPQHLHYIWMRK